MRILSNIFRKAEISTLVVLISISGLVYGATVAQGEESVISGMMNTPGTTIIALPAVTLTATPGLCGTGSIHLAWNTVSGADGYRLFRDSTGNQIYEGPDTTHEDHGLPNGSQHTYYLQAYKAGVTPSYTSITAQAPLACPTVSGTDGVTDTYDTLQGTQTTQNTQTQTTTATPVAIAKNLAAQFNLSVGGVELVWGADGSPTGFAIFRRTFPSEFQSIGTISGVMRYVDKSIVPATSYEYLVRACGSTGCSNASNIVGVQTPQYTVSTVPINTSTTATSTAVTATTPKPVSVTTTVTPTSTTASPKPTTVPVTTTPPPSTVARPTVTTAPPPPTGSFTSRTDRTPPPEPTYIRVPPPPRNATPPQFNAAEAQAFVGHLETVSETVETAQASINNAQDELIASIDAHVKAVLQAGVTENPQEAEAAVRAIRETLVNEINRTVGTSVSLSEAQLNSLQKFVSDGFTKIDRAAQIDLTVHDVTRDTAAQSLNTLASTMQNAVAALQSGGAADLYKDTNKDGISDYDSKRIYNLDPIAPSPVTVVNGETLTAGDKVLRGYDPTAKELVALPLEEPATSPAPETTVYKVEEIKLTPQKQIKITGTALPNSYVTLYVYSTPIVVTVKTDRNGKWEYTMDRELETGEHKIYAAAVDNTGKIVAKTAAIPFTRTAEAATLDSVPPLGAASVERPGLSNNRVSMPLVLISILFIIGVLYVIGKDHLPKRDNTPPSGPSHPSGAISS